MDSERAIRVNVDALRQCQYGLAMYERGQAPVPCTNLATQLLTVQGCTDDCEPEVHDHNVWLCRPHLEYVALQTGPGAVERM